MINIKIASLNQQSNTNPSASPVSESSSCSYSEATTQSTPKMSSFNLFNKKTKAQETEKHRYSVIATAKFADRPRPTGHSPHFYPQSLIPYPPIRVKRKYTKRKHNNNNNTK